MALRQRWVAQCDHQKCSQTVVLDKIPYGTLWDYGEALNDLNWDAGPGRPETYCPSHRPDAKAILAEAQR